MVNYDYGKADYYCNTELMNQHLAKLDPKIVAFINKQYSTYWNSLADDPENPNAEMPTNLWEKAINLPLDPTFRMDFLFVFGTWAISHYKDEYKKNNEVCITDKHIEDYLKNEMELSFTNKLSVSQKALIEFMAKGFKNAVFF